MMNKDVDIARLSRVFKYNHLIEMLNNLDEEEMHIMIMIINTIQMEKNLVCGRVNFLMKRGECDE